MIKTTLILVFLMSSIFCFGQIKSENLVGNWESDGGTILNDSTRHISIKKFILHINKNKSFKILTNKKTTSGKWILKDSVLYLTGKKGVSKSDRKNKLKIYALTKSKLILKPEGLESKKPIVLVRRNKK